MRHTSSLAPRARTLDVESLTDRLRDAPLQALEQLKTAAAALDLDTGGRDGLEQAPELVRLAQVAMVEFQALTRLLDALVDELAAREQQH